MSTIALHSLLNISETVTDRGLVAKDHQKEMTYGLSNGHVTDDVTGPQRCCEAVRSAILATAWLLCYLYPQILMVHVHVQSVEFILKNYSC